MLHVPEHFMLIGQGFHLYEKAVVQFRDIMENFAAKLQ